MEGTDLDKHFRGYQPQPVVDSNTADSDAADFVEADKEAQEMLAAASEADDKVPPYPRCSTPSVPSQSGTPTVLFDRDACRKKMAKRKIKNQKQRI